MSNENLTTCQNARNQTTSSKHLGECVENKFSESDVAKVITQSKSIAARLNEISGKDVIEVRKKLLDLAQTKIPYFREMKGKALDRVFWQIVTLENLQDVESIV
jgi:hypothetical protein